jgi:hypothetical protein
VFSTDLQTECGAFPLLQLYVGARQAHLGLLQTVLLQHFRRYAGPAVGRVADVANVGHAHSSFCRALFDKQFVELRHGQSQKDAVGLAFHASTVPYTPTRRSTLS